MIQLEGAPRSNITIAGVVLSVPSPFVEGHVLRSNEAAALNQVYAENARNNFTATVKKAKEEAEKLGTPIDGVSLQASLDKYLDEYDFGVRRIGARTTVDPIMREALVIARQKVRNALRKKGLKVTDFSAEKITELAESAIQKYPKILEDARRVVEVKKSVGSDSLEIEA